METIQVVPDSNLLEAANRVARQLKRNRTALVRDALREYIRRLD
jgi:metal-responsive CopG/Arc/MetJ family transcriptional regulator